MKQFIVHDYDAQIPQKTDIYSPQTLNRQEEIERWTAILNSELNLSYVYCSISIQTNRRILKKSSSALQCLDQYSILLNLRIE